MDLGNRVVVLIDMDCFYCQVEEKLNPELKGKPIAVVQYNPWKGGGIIAVNYVARAMGVTRHMRGDEAKDKCPEIQLPSVACMRGKADISKYRDAGTEVAKVLNKFAPILERASIDEAYLDITSSVQERLNTLNVNSITLDSIPNTHALGYDSVTDFISDVQNYGSDSIEFDYEHTKQLLVGAHIVSEIRKAVFEETGYTCSAGIAHNKILAKLVCGMNKPNKQTILPKHSINILYSTLSVKKVKHLGGKFGDTVCEVLKIKNMSELQSFTEKELQSKFDEKNGTWLYNIARGIDLEPVQAKFNPKSIGCCKQFRGKSALLDLDNLKKWLVDLGDEIEDRLEKDALENNRSPRQMVVSFSTYLPDGRDVSSSRSYNFVADDELCGELLTKKSLELIMETTEGTKLKDDESNRKLKAPIKFLGISVGKFEDHVDSKKTRNIMDYFAAGASKEVATKSNDKQLDKVAETANKSEGKEYILQKFFQVSNKIKTEQPKNDSSEVVQENVNKEVVVEAALEKQESFFAKFLNNNKNTALAVEHPKPGSSKYVDDSTNKDNVHPPTPVCDVINCGENSNDTDYSSSTINMEINKSIALFEDDPQDVARVSNMRQLLNSTVIDNDEDKSEIVSLKSNDDNQSVTDDTNLSNDSKHSTKSSRNHIISKVESNSNAHKVLNVREESEETFKCPECSMSVSIDMLDTHADYHVALKLREEERQQARLERKERSIEDSKRKKPTTENRINNNVSIRPVAQSNKNEMSSISSFLTKIDNNVPTEVCSECGKRIPIEKFAEHLDFHEAQKLSREINKKSSQIHTPHSINITKKRKSTSPVRKPKVPCKSIDSFFR